MSKILTDAERDELIQKYEEDKLNKPPKNIKDETLIANYGTDEQKSRLHTAPATEAPKATENEPTGEAGTGTAPAEPIPATEPQGETEQSVEPASAPAQTPDDNAAYVNAFNDYVHAFAKMPNDKLTTAELVKLVADKKAQDEKDAEIAEQIKKRAKQMQVNKTQNVVIVDKTTGEEMTVPLFTWEKFISKDGTHSLKVETPKELKAKK